MQLKKNKAGQKGFFVAMTAAGASVEAGIAGDISIDGAATAAAAGTFTHLTGGLWSYAFTQAETNATESIALIPSGGSVQPTLASWDVQQYNATWEVHESRVWRPNEEGNEGGNTVSIGPNFVGTLAVDFNSVLNPGTFIDTVNTPTSSDVSIVFANEAASSADATIAHFDVTGGLTAGTSPTVAVSVVTTDGQTFEMNNLALEVATAG